MTSMDSNAVVPKPGRFGPALTLVLLAPLIAEVLPGATRMSSIFVLPLEMAIWGGGALLIRAAVRHWNLGWLHMFLMACALSIAEEFVIQQTSIAPPILQIVKGFPDYARAGGVNYVYFLWALFYEAVLVVMVPVIITELIYESRRYDPWLGRVGAIVVSVVFLIACVPAWFLWTQLVREQVFHFPHYAPPAGWVIAGLAAIAVLVSVAIGPARHQWSGAREPLAPLNPWLLGAAAFITACVWHAICVLAFGIRPEFPTWIPLTVGLGIAALGIYLLPRYAAHPQWGDCHRMGIAFGASVGSMAIGFIGFIYGTSALDFYGKLITNVIAVVLLITLAMRVGRRRGA
jgi:hypothetical protein